MIFLDVLKKQLLANKLTTLPNTIKVMISSLAPGSTGANGNAFINHGMKHFLKIISYYYFEEELSSAENQAGRLLCTV